MKLEAKEAVNMLHEIKDCGNFVFDLAMVVSSAFMDHFNLLPVTAYKIHACRPA